MGTFSEVEMNMPPGKVVVPPEAWDVKWDERPLEEVCLGLRLVPDADLEDARVEAFKRAAGLFPDHEKSDEATELFVASFKDTLVRWVIARGTCDPNNVRAVWEGWAAAPEDTAVELALTDLGAQLIFDAWESMRISSNISVPVASDADLLLLPVLLSRLPTLRFLSTAREQRCRRLLRFVLEELESVEPESTTEGVKTLHGATSAEESTTVSPSPEP